ncbi:unnamed protein product [Fusarium graminearum]|nr:unnamed protein product [Fusarium graminearum]
MSSQLLAARFRFYPKPLSQTGTSSLANLSFFQPNTRWITISTVAFNLLRSFILTYMPRGSLLALSITEAIHIGHLSFRTIYEETSTTSIQIYLIRHIVVKSGWASPAHWEALVHETTISALSHDWLSWNCTPVGRSVVKSPNALRMPAGCWNSRNTKSHYIGALVVPWQISSTKWLTIICPVNMT